MNDRRCTLCGKRLSDTTKTHTTYFGHMGYSGVYSSGEYRHEIGPECYRKNFPKNRKGQYI